MIVGTAGHIDHGKTALVKALTGIDTDRLRQEKERGITIDLGYAYTPLTDGEILGFVDVPGHERFIPNMLAGATGIDYVLLVVAADDGPMPQTVEHLQILDLLGLRRGGVALTKTDRVSEERLDAARIEIEALLSGTLLAGSPIFPVSAISGNGVQKLRAHLEDVAAQSGKRSLRGGFRLAVDRSFVLTGVGTVVTGSVFAGQVRIGDRLLLSPSGLWVRVRGIHAQNRPAETGWPGQRCALNLVGVEKHQVRRGDWVLSAELHAPTTRIDVRLRLLATEKKALPHWTSVHVHLGAGHGAGHVALLRGETLEPGEETLAQLVLDKPVCAVHGDRAILRDSAGQRTLAGAWVLDSSPPARGRRTERRLAALAAWSRHSPTEILAALLDCSPSGVVLAAFSRNLNLTADEIDALLKSIPLRKIEARTPSIFSFSHWSSLKDASIAALAQEHRDAPDTLGLNVEQLRLRAAPTVDRRTYGELVAELVREGLLARDGSWLHLPGHEISLGTPEETLWAAISPLLGAAPFQPPRVRDIAKILQLDETVVRRLLTQTARIGRVYRVAHDHYFDRQAVADLADLAKQLAGDTPDGAVLASRFRDRIGVGRKLAIQILEFFDRVGLTRRVRDEHRLRDDMLAF